MVVKEFKVKGMHCKSCEMLINDSLEDLGVNSVTSSHEKGRVKGDLKENKINEDKIIEVIKEEGYKVE